MIILDNCEITQLSESALNKVWFDWNMKMSADNAFISSYSRVSRRSSSAQQFENYLYSHGALVQRINKKCYLHFNDPIDAMAFKLKHA
jgi:hypothetical protein